MDTTSATEASATLAPLHASKRIDILDIIRGFALVGILLMNIEWFGGRPLGQLGTHNPDLTGLDSAVAWLVRCFVEGKFYKLFALLFGMGFAIMLVRAKEAGRPFVAWFSRRMIVLYAIGVLHMVFLWGGDILHDYAAAGLMLLAGVFLLRHPRLQKYDNPRSLLKLGLIWLFLPVVLMTGVGIGTGVMMDYSSQQEMWQKSQHVASLVQGIEANPLTEDESDIIDTTDPAELQEEPVESMAEINAEEGGAGESQELSPEEEAQDIYWANQELEDEYNKEIYAFTTGSYWQATRYRMEFASEMLLLSPLFSLSMLVPIFILGYCLVVSGIMRETDKYKTLFKTLAIVGTGFGLIMTVGGLIVAQHPASENDTLLMMAGSGMFFAGQYVLTAGYFGILVLASLSAKWYPWLAHFAPMGRMALTHYVMHSLILTTLFYGYGVGLWGQLTRFEQLGMVALILIFQLFASKWWLSRYQFGPLEWIWRSLTYKKAQPMKLG